MDKSINERAWLEERRMGIGGSDIGAIVGVSPFKTALDVFLEKTGQKFTEENESMRLGTALEPFVVKRYEENTGLKCVNQRAMFHDGFIVANIDRIVDMGDGKTENYDGIIESSRILEAKTARYEWDDGVPLSYQCQVQWYMGPFESVETCDVAVYYTGGQKDPFHIFSVNKDKDVYAELVARGKEFWEKYILTGTMPPPQNEEDCRTIWARHRDSKSVIADDKVTKLIERLRGLKEELDAKEDEVSKVTSEVMKFMKDAEILKTMKGGVLATWKTSKDSLKVDYKALLKACNISYETIAKYSETKAGSRRFCIK